MLYVNEAWTRSSRNWESLAWYYSTKANKVHPIVGSHARSGFSVLELYSTVIKRLSHLWGTTLGDCDCGQQNYPNCFTG